MTMRLKKLKLLTLGIALCSGIGSAGLTAFADEVVEIPETEVASIDISAAYVGTGEVPETTDVYLKNDDGIVSTLVLTADTLRKGSFVNVKPGDYTIEEEACPSRYTTATNWSTDDETEYLTSQTSAVTIRVVAGHTYHVSFMNTYEGIPDDKTTVRFSAVWGGEGEWPDELSHIAIDLSGKDSVTNECVNPAGKQILSADNNYTYTYTLDKNSAAGNPIVYEPDVATPTGYICTTTGDATTGFVLTYTKSDEEVPSRPSTPSSDTVSFRVHLSWLSDTAEPSATVYLVANGVTQGHGVDVSSNNVWDYVFEDLPVKDEDGNAIEYSVQPAYIYGYTTNTYGDTTHGFTIEYTKSETTDWDVDATSLKGKTDSVTLNLVTNNVITQTVVVSDDTNWVYTFKDLPTDANYYVIATGTDGTQYMVAGPNGSLRVSYDREANETVTIPVTIEWQGGSVESTVVRVMANGAEVASDTVTAAKGWKTTFAGLPVTDREGTKIVYTVTQDTNDLFVAGNKKNDDGSWIFRNTMKSASKSDDKTSDTTDTTKKDTDSTKTDNNTNTGNKSAANLGSYTTSSESPGSKAASKTTSEPSATATPESNQSGTYEIKNTGVTSNMPLYAGLGAVSIAVILGVLVKRHKGAKE